MVLPECLLVCWDPSLDWGHCCALPCCAPPCLFTSYAVFFFFCLRSCLINLSAVRPVTMETRCFHKKLEFQRYPPKDFCTARYERKSWTKKFQTFQKPRKKSFLGRSWAKIGLRITQPNVCSKRRDSESWTDIERQNQRLRHEI